MKEKKKIRRAARVLAFALMMACMGMLVSAPVKAADAPVIDAAAKGSLTINKKGAGDAPLKDAGFTIYKVVNLAKDGDTMKYTVADGFGDVLDSVSLDELGNYSAQELEGLCGDLKDAAESATGIFTQTKETDAAGVAKFADLTLGYYLVVETTVPEGYVGGRPFLVAIPSTNNYNADPDAVGTGWVYDVVANPKNSQTSFVKEVAAIEGTTAPDETVGLGDYVQYKLTAEIPNYGDEYFADPDGVVIYTITDVLSDGLTITQDASHKIAVTVDSTDVPETVTGTTKKNYEVTAVEKSGTNPDLTIAFTTEFVKTNRGKEVVVTYWAKINEKAVMGTAGITNKATLTYSNDPSDLSSTETMGAEEKVYSFGIKIAKFTTEIGTENKKTGLSGAKFEIYLDKALTNLARTGDDDAAVVYTTSNDGTVSINLLDEGTYYLKEVEAPKGFTLLSNPIEVKITAEKDADDKPTGKFVLSVDGTNISAKDSTDKFVTSGSDTTGVATIAVENHKGFTLPTTGGAGIAAFLVIGMAGILVLSVSMMRKMKKSR